MKYKSTSVLPFSNRALSHIFRVLYSSGTYFIRNSKFLAAPF